MVNLIPRFLRLYIHCRWFAPVHPICVSNVVEIVGRQLAKLTEQRKPSFALPVQHARILAVSRLGSDFETATPPPPVWRKITGNGREQALLRRQCRCSASLREGRIR